MHQYHPESHHKSLSDRRTKQVADCFDNAAQRYEKHAKVQKQAALNLADCILKHSSPESTTRILELGCGPGLLTEQLIRPFCDSQWTITDIAPQMVEICRNRILEKKSPAHCNFLQMDAQAVSATGPFDLICSNLTFQWLSDLSSVVEELSKILTPSKHLIFNTLGADTFRYWQELDSKIEGERTAPEFPTVEDIQQELSKALELSEFEIHLSSENLEDVHPSFLDFLNSLKQIGANTPVGGEKVPLSQLRKLIRLSAANCKDNSLDSISMNYQVITAVITRNQC